MKPDWPLPMTEFFPTTSPVLPTPYQNICFRIIRRKLDAKRGQQMSCLRHSRALATAQIVFNGKRVDDGAVAYTSRSLRTRRTTRCDKEHFDFLKLKRFQHVVRFLWCFIILVWKPTFTELMANKVSIQSFYKINVSLQSSSK